MRCADASSAQIGRPDGVALTLSCMPVIATPTAARILSRDEVRRWMRDFPPGLIPKTGVINALLDACRDWVAAVDGAS